MRKADIFYYSLLLIVIVVLIYMAVLMKSETTKCIRNPYVYGAKKMGNVSCDCQQLINPTCPAKFFFSDDGFENPVTRCGTQTNYSFNFDLSSLNISQ